MQLRALAVTTLVVLGAVAVPAAEARTDNRTKPIYYVHGYENGSDANCNQWSDMTTAMAGWGHTGAAVRIKYYHNDSNCTRAIDHHGSHSTHYGNTGHHNGTSHTEDANIQHLGYHLAWDIYDHYSQYGTYVDVVAHSMGGLITRYAIAGVQNQLSGFPPSIRVEDVVTFGTPHGGARFASACVINCNTQIQQMKMGSSLLTGMESTAWNPQGTGGTDWTTMGSDDDNSVAADRAAATDSDRNPVNKYMGSCHKAWYTTKNDIEHSDFLHDTSSASTAEVYVRHCPTNSFTFYTAGLWPVKRADQAVVYGSQ